ncbi:MAG: tetratricopeptide repeat protein [Bdellovibrionota bacterium]
MKNSLYGRLPRGYLPPFDVKSLLCGVLMVVFLGGCSGKPTITSESLNQEIHLSKNSNGDKELPIDQMEIARLNTQRAQSNTMASAEYHFSLAQAYSAEGSTDRAIEEFKTVLMFDPKSAFVHTRLAAEYIKKGMLSAAMETCKDALKHDAKFVDARLMLAGLYSNSKEFALALTEYDEILKFDPKHEEAVIFKSQVLMEAGKSKEVAKFLREFLKKDHDSVLAWYYLGRAEQVEEHFDESVVAYKKALSLKPGFAQAALSLGYLYEERGKNALAITVYKTLYEENRDLAAANRLATIHLKEERYKEAVPYLQYIQISDPDDANVRVKLGLVHMELKEYDKATAIFSSLLQKNPESDRLHYYLGSIFEEVKKFDDAISEFKLIKPDSRLYQDAMLHVAYLIKQYRSVSEAKEFIAAVALKSPHVPSFIIFQASLEEETKNISKALQLIEEAAKKFPNDEKVLYYLGTLYDRQGDTDKSLIQMEAILKLSPDNVDAMNYIGYTWTQKGIRLNDAEKLLKKALQLKPNNAYIQDSWGWHLFVMGRISEAVVELEKAVQLKPDESTILEHLADAYLRKNLREKALAKYLDALKYTDDAVLKEKLEIKLQNLRTEMAQENNDNQDKNKIRVPAANNNE